MGPGAQIGIGGQRNQPYNLSKPQVDDNPIMGPGASSGYGAGLNRQPAKPQLGSAVGGLSTQFKSSVEDDNPIMGPGTSGFSGGLNRQPA